MRRRHYLGALALAGLAGCQEGTPDATPTEGDGDGQSVGSPTDPSESTPTADSTTGIGDVDLPVSDDQLSRGAGKDAIPAITEPAFADDWSDYTLEISRFGNTTTKDVSLAADDEVIGVERDGEARAYPLRVLNYHEIVNDTFGGPLLVSFCPLCGSGVTAVRRVDGEETTFGVSGLLWNSDLVMYDEATESLWSQILGKAIQGPKTGTALELVPSRLTTWGEWLETHPETKVLVPPPESNTVRGPKAVRDYSTNPYPGYGDSSRVGIGRNEVSDTRLPLKAEVLGIATDEAATAYPLSVVVEKRVINDTVGDRPVVVAATPGDAMVAYERTVGGEVLTFEATDDPAVVRAGGSRWRVTTGRALDGPHEGTELAVATELTSMFWFAWVDFHPGTDVYGQSG